MEQRSAQTDVAAVGGGMAGLTAACYLARAGVGRWTRSGPGAPAQLLARLRRKGHGPSQECI